MIRNRILDFFKAVTTAGVQFSGTAKLLGRTSSGGGDGQEISLGTGLGFTGTTLNITLVAGTDYLTPGAAASTYLTQASASSTYLTISSASSTYLTSAAAAAAYQPLDADLTAIAGLSTTTYGRSFLALADESAARDLLNVSTKFTDLGSGGFLPPAVYPDAKKHHFIYRKSGSDLAGTLGVVLPSASNSIVGQRVTIYSATNIAGASITVSGGGAILGAAFTTVVAGTVYEWTCIETSGTGTWIRTR